MPSRTITSADSTRRHGLALLLAAVMVVLLLSFAGTLPAAAVDPFVLPEQISDQIGAVEGRIEEIQAALDDLEADHGVRMWVVFVDTFDGTDPQQWADATFAATGLGVNDSLLAVAITDRQYGYVVDSDFVLDDAALARVATAAERHLAENPARAVTEAAARMGEELDSGPGVSDGTVPGWVPAAVIGGFAAFLLLLGVGRVRHGLPFAPDSVRQLFNEMGTGRRDRDSEDSWSSGGGDTRGGSGSF